ncbi:hypothetical protein [Flammeovirga aprica]|uniref:Uncharacterized protein n=1 Tax=Flammeovirga aprica JL-4 TaxID=694437 RepID=A0A7X9P3I7_9BACT|nr:hypothetical protein [Flammeovirga aprica]NME67994.1 hypothetical protein [Flammeovirga aprica JL-4]
MKSYLGTTVGVISSLMGIVVFLEIGRDITYFIPLISVSFSIFFAFFIELLNLRPIQETLLQIVILGTLFTAISILQYKLRKKWWALLCFVLQFFIVHSLFFCFMLFGSGNNGDGQVIFHIYKTFPYSSQIILFMGIIIDFFQNRKGAVI